MSDIAVDSSGDLLLEGGRARLATDAEAVAQSWQTHLTMFRGECFTDRSLGIDYQNEVLEKGTRPAVLRAIFAQASRETPGVREVSDLRFSLNRATRELAISVEVVLETGDEATFGLNQSLGG